MDTESDGTEERSESAHTNDLIRDAVLRAATMQVASLTGLVHFWIEWAQATETYTKGLGDELTRIQADKDATDTVGKVSDLTREYVRQVTDLPAAAARAFLTEVERFNATEPVTTKSRKRVRSVRAKP